ncbi:MAG: methylated-DNA--[protein]-cysteine S-methyltransferase [Slackia sp.]|nr:methylated-DNA--[protein]-cysteine S-methyltransferase [Slackia sp.]
MNYFVYAMPPGRLSIAASDRGITRIAFGDVPLDMPCRPSAITNAAATQLQEYFAGKRKTFDVPVDLQGTPFQLEVWNSLCTIPYGQTRTYADIAAQIDRPKAFRAVGMANNKNPVPIIVPCHRVIGAGGKLIGYAAGIKVKRYLLELEGMDPEALR